MEYVWKIERSFQDYDRQFNMENVAKSMLNLKDPMVECERTILYPVASDNHCPKPVSNSANVCVWCVVWGLETRMQKSCGIETVDTCDRSSNHLATHINPNCDPIADSHVSSTNRWLAFKIPQFVGLSCFKIAHHEQSTGLFSVTARSSGAADIQTCFKCSWQHKSTMTSHIVCNMICCMYMDINFPAYVNGEVAHLVIVPKICLKPPCEVYSTMEVSLWKTHFSNLPKLDPTSSLDENQPFTVSFINADNNIIVDL